ncbi:MAG: cyclase [Ardenticatenaceae bacterium]|nr:cyclase [Ardenticatenaceae bacterium]MCB9446458.1 cyclase [Ardenticatenaceae bacterium]
MLVKTRTKYRSTYINTSLNSLIKQLLQEMGAGIQISPSAYDTAWVARLAEIGEPIGEEALEWLRSNQLEDGSWGASEPLYYHDRVICTLSAIIALSTTGESQDWSRIEKAIPTLREYATKLDLDPAGETIAFEMLLPTLMAEAKALGILPQGGTAKLNNMVHIRTHKLANSPGRKISRLVTLAFSSEIAGTDGLHVLDVNNLQEPNGSVGYSPSATAHFVRYVSPHNQRGLQYLKTISRNGGFANVVPFDVFEQAWVLWNLSITNVLDEGLIAICQTQLDSLEKAWKPGKGVGYNANYLAKDSDETGVAFEVLSRFGRSLDLDAILGYEEDEYFRCFEIEANPSISANIHVLGALREAGFSIQDTPIRKINNFLRQKRTPKGYWIDKWHASPYYPTAHAIIANAGYDNALVKDAVSWIISTQNSNGSWGYYTPTAEETAYCLQALSIWRQNYGTIPFGVIERGVYWLVNHMDPPYPPLWIGKCLYSPNLVIRSAILSALILSSQMALISSKNGVNFSDS